MSSSTPTDGPPRWTLLLPVKGGRRAKTRLGGPAELARALAMDCLDAVLTCPGVGTTLVVTSDAHVAARAGAAGALVHPERRPGAGLNAAVSDALAATACDYVAVLLADLPALRPDELAGALDAAAACLQAPGAPSSWVFVPDAEGTGTVLLAASSPALIKPAFGPGSAAAHAFLGAVRLDLDSPGLRRDVDTLADLQQARAIGLGPHTSAALDVWGWRAG